ncbi:hypothetical protein [Cupriavidus campinensis]
MSHPATIKGKLSMPIDPTTLAEARALVAKVGMADFATASATPASTVGHPVPHLSTMMKTNIIGKPPLDSLIIKGLDSKLRK